MSTLSELKCVTCNKNAKLLTPIEIEVLLREISGWAVIIDKGTHKLTRQFKTKNYQQSILFTNEVAELAIIANHHPQIIVEYACVTVIWWSHIIKGLHRNDFIMAAKTSDVF